MTADRCPAAHPEDPTGCEGPPDAVRVMGQRGGQVLGCVHHGARLYASLVSPRVYPMPGYEGGALEVARRAQHLSPFPWRARRGGAR